MGPLFGEKGTFEVPFEVQRFHLRSMIPDTFDQNTWWGTQIHGGEPTYMVAWPASQPDGASKYVMAWPASRPGFGKNCRLECKWNVDSKNGTRMERGSSKSNAHGT